MKVIFIGGGNIAEAIFPRLIDYEVIVVEHNKNRFTEISNKYPNVQFSDTLEFNTAKDDILLVAIKPQNAKESCCKIKHLIHKDTTIVSVMAGITVANLAKWLDNDNIVRVMPNTPSILGLGVSGIFFSPQISQQQYQEIYNIITKIGHAYVLDSEDAIDRMTAISASAPAYIFYFIESLINTAVHEFNFNHDAAKEITLQVIQGSLAMINQQPDISISQLRQNITSQNGTTEAGINVLIKHNFENIIHEMEMATYNRAREIGKSYD